MPLLAGLLVTMFGSLAAWFGAWLSKKAALAAAAISTFGVLTVAFYAGMTALFSGLITVFPGGVLGSVIWMAVPDSAAATIAATIGADTAVALYRWNVENLRLASYVT